MEGREDFFVRVVYAFTASNPDELSGNEGDIVKVRSQVNEHWYEGQIKGKKGLFPVIYATKIDDPLQYEEFVAIEAYNGVRCSELSFSKGENINVIEKVNENWWRGESNGKIGIFPNSFVENEKLYESIGSEEDVDNAFYQNGGLYGNQDAFSVQSLYEFEARNREELSFPQGAIIIINKDIDDDWYEGNFGGKTGLFPKSYVEPILQDIYEMPARACARSIYPFVGESESELTFKEGELIFLRKRAGSQWLEGEIDGNIGLFPASFVDVQIDLPPEEEANSSKTNNDHSRRFLLPQKTLWREGNRARALYHFSALHTGDLALNEGDVITIVKVVDDNWIEGRLDSGVSGMCPAAYLALADITNNGHVQAGESSICRELKEGLMARENIARTSQQNLITSDSRNSRALINPDSYGGRRHSLTESRIMNDFSDSGFGLSSNRAMRLASLGDDRVLRPSNKGKPAPKPPQIRAQLSGSSDGTDVGTPTRSVSKSSPSQSSISTPPQSNRTSIYAIPFKSSQNKFSPVSFNPSKSRGSGVLSSQSKDRGEKRTSSTNYGFDSQDGGRSSGRDIGTGSSLLDMSVSNRASVNNLLTPLVPLPSNNNTQQPTNSGSEEYPIVPKRKAPLPPKKTIVNDDYRSNSLPRTHRNQIDTKLTPDELSESKQFGSCSIIGQVNSKIDNVGLRPAPRKETAHKKRPPPPPVRYNKDKFSNITRSATISSSRMADYKQDKEKEKDTKRTRQRPASVYYVGEDRVWACKLLQIS
jgi:hypothetical protein